MPYLTDDDGIPLCRKAGVYSITNLKNGRVYVGSATSVRGRMKDHLNKLRAGKHVNLHLQAAWNKYGKAAFRFDVIETCDIKDLLAREQRWIDALGAAKKGTGYNICPKAYSRLGVRHSSTARAKMSAAKKGKPGLRTGAILSEETKAKMARSATGKRASPETRAKMSASQSRRVYTEDDCDRAKRCHWSKGPNAKAIAAKIAAARVGVPHSPETKAKISSTKLQANRPTSP